MKYGAYIIGCSDCNEEVCAAAGRISTQSGTALEIFERSHDEDKNTSLIGKVTRSGHTSTIEHIFFNLAFENVSVVVEQFMIEFRLASFTVKSRRYVDFSDCGYYNPEFKNEENKEITNMIHNFLLISESIIKKFSVADIESLRAAYDSIYLSTSLIADGKIDEAMCKYSK